MDELSIGDAELEALAKAQMNGGRGADLPPATFSVEAIYNEQKSKELNRAVYTDVDMIEIRVGRDTVRRPVSEADKRVYAAQYLAFKKDGNGEAVEGFPLSQWAVIPGKAVVKEFAHFGIRTVEQLAATNDTTLQTIGPYMGLRQKARDWVAESQKQAPLAKIRSENDELKARLQALEEMVAKQSTELAAARAAGGVLPQKPADDGRMAALEERLAALTARLMPAAQTPEVVQSVSAPPEVPAVKLNKDGTPRKKPGPKAKALQE